MQFLLACGVIALPVATICATPLQATLENRSLTYERKLFARSSEIRMFLYDSDAGEMAYMNCVDRTVSFSGEREQPSV